MKRLTSAFAILLAVLLLVGVPPALFAEKASDELHILACSDFQAKDGNKAGQANVAAILDAMRADGVTEADDFFACGDYDYEYTDTRSGILMLSSAVKGFVKGNKLFVQGNHDSANSAAGKNGLAKSGANDPAHGKYGAFVINEEDYMWYNDDKSRIERTAQNLIDYLNEKLAEGYDKPIFLLSHLGLHYSMRTYNEGYAMHARYLFNAINEAGKKGLNIFFLFGHDHSNGWDDYLGGASIYLAKGNSILVPQGNYNAKKSETLAFTYLNAGYIGYYENVNGQDDALTMTYITIRDNEVSLARYDKNGVHDLKSKGVKNTHKNERGYEPDETVYSSPQTVALGKVADRTPIANLLNIDKTLPLWQRLEKLSELESGKSYLLVYNGTTDGVMLPKTVTKENSSGERIGFDLVSADAFGDTLAYANPENALWTLEKTADGWLLKSADSAANLEKADGHVAAVLSKDGLALTVKEEDGEFTFSGGGYHLNYNSRGLINFYASNPASFYIYEAIGYGITVNGGTATANGESVSFAQAGTTLTLSAQDAPAGYIFDKWEITLGSLALDDPAKAEQTLVMPESGIALKAVYRSTAPDATTTGDPAPIEPDDFPTAAVVIVVSVVACAALAATVIVLVKKKKA